MLPDIVTLAKGIGNGLPLAAVVTTPEIAAVMASRLHFNTYGAGGWASGWAEELTAAERAAEAQP